MTVTTLPERCRTDCRLATADAPLRALLAALMVVAATSLSGCAALIPAAHTAAAAVAANSGAVAVAAGAGAGILTGLAAPEIRKALTNDKSGEGAAQEQGTLGAFLASSQTEVRNLVQRARESQRDALVVAGIRVQSAMARGRTVFRDNLSTSVSALGEPEKRFKSDMEALVSNLYSPADSIVKEAGERAQAMANRLRPAGAIPVLNAGGPVYLFASLPYQSVSISGRFPASYAGQAVPQLTIGGSTYRAFDYSADSLRFNVPTTDLNLAEAKQIVWKSAVVSVPWSAPGNFFTAPEIEQLNVELAVLPDAFGHLSIERAVSNVKKEERPRFSRDFRLGAGEASASGAQCLELTPEEVAAGWKIQPGTSAFVPGAGSAGSQALGALKLHLASETANSACWSVAAANADAAAESGAAAPSTPPASVTWRISAIIGREISESATTRESVDLAWGSQHYFRIPAGAWKLRYARTGSPERELIAADASQPFIQVKTDATGVAVSIYPF